MIYVFLADGFEEIEALTAVDVLRRFGANVLTAGVGGSEITGAHGIAVHTDILLGETEPDRAQMLVLPGGMPGAENLLQSAKLRDIITAVHGNGGYLAAICAAPMILGRMGLLENREAVCYPSYEKDLRGAKILSQNVAVSGRIITGSGPSAALEFALTLGRLLKGDAKFSQVAEDMLCRL